jgi:L-fuculose-phosphate aldolase
VSERRPEESIELEAARRCVLEVVHEMNRVGLTEGSAGNVSMRTRAGEIVLTPTAMAYAEMTAQDLVVADENGAVAPGQRSATTEIGLHMACLKRHSDIAAVVHTHPIHASMFAVNHQSIPCVLEEFEFAIGGDVQVAPYFPTGSKELGDAVAELLGDRAAALMSNHGLVVVGSSPSEALHLTKLVERAAQIVWGASAMGDPKPLPKENRRIFRSQYLERRSQCS